MGQSREGTPSNSNFLAALHSGLEQAHEVRHRRPYIQQRATWRSLG
jgi:hypothetical protein